MVDNWTSIVSTINYLKTFDLDGDGIIENSGAPDQTFDDWRLQGVSAYCGGLWLTALECAIAIGNILTSEYLGEINPNPHELIPQYQQWLMAKPLYHKLLWNGEYYRIDTNSNSPVIMADQLCGQYFAQLLKLPDLVPPESAEIALENVYQSCFLNFHNGQYGAANGLRKDGTPLNSNDTHPLEIWTGINFGIAAFLISLGMKDQGLKLTETVVDQIYQNGLQFRTPEAITSTGQFRASHYLRAMAIWAVYHSLTNH